MPRASTEYVNRMWASNQEISIEQQLRETQQSRSWPPECIQMNEVALGIHNILHATAQFYCVSSSQWKSSVWSGSGHQGPYYLQCGLFDSASYCQMTSTWPCGYLCVEEMRPPPLFFTLLNYSPYKSPMSIFHFHSFISFLFGSHNFRILHSMWQHLHPYLYFP